MNSDVLDSKVVSIIRANLGVVMGMMSRSLIFSGGFYSSHYILVLVLIETKGKLEKKTSLA